MSHQAPVEEGRAAIFQQRGGVVVCHRIIPSLGGEERGGEGGRAGGGRCGEMKVVDKDEK